MDIFIPKLRKQMRKIIFIALTLASIFNVNAQDVGVEFHALAGYQMGASTSTYYYGDFRYRPSDSYQFSLNFPIEDVVEVELSYSYSSSYCDFDAWYLDDDLPFVNNRADAIYNYYQLGFLRGTDLSEKVNVYGLLSLGASHMNFTDRSQFKPGYSSEDVWRFSFSFGLGAKIYATNRLGVRVQGKINAPISGVGFGVGCGTGGCGTGVSTVSFFVQGEVQGGLFLVLKPQEKRSKKNPALQNSSAGLW